MSLMITCKKATEFISKREENKLSFWNRIQLWQHLAICGFCKLFMKQNKFITENIAKIENKYDASLSSEEKQKMIKNLQESI
jgi:hypothetical protein